jgi:hypothetical protein
MKYYLPLYALPLVFLYDSYIGSSKGRTLRLNDFQQQLLLYPG